jgi:hypothetical protein
VKFLAPRLSENLCTPELRIEIAISSVNSVNEQQTLCHILQILDICLY